jgi:hypothetical protein
MLHVIDGTWQPNEHDKQNGLVPGFGVTTQIINGGVECGGNAEHAQSQNRINYYREFANYLAVPVPADEVLGCKGMKYFDNEGAGALPIYWEQDWSYVAENPNGGKSYACKLVGYQTRFSAFKEGDYTRCVQHFYPELVIEDNGGGTNLPPVASITGPAQAEGGSKVTLSAQHSSDPEGKPLAYAWTIPAGATSVSGQGTSSISFRFPTGFTSGTISVSLSGCGAPIQRSIVVSRTLPATPGTISGPVNLCSFRGTNTAAAYSVSVVANATFYNWTLPKGISMVKH